MIALRVLKASDIKRSKPVTRYLKATREVELLDGRRWCYRVDLDRCDTPAKLLGWILHLTEKTWVERKHIRELIQHAQRENGITIDFNV